MRKALIYLAALLVVAATTHAATNEVFQVKVSLQGFFKTPYLVVKSNVRSDDLVNLARGRPARLTRRLAQAYGQTVPRPPRNEILALAINCDSTTMWLIVFDPGASSNLATIAELESIDGFSGSRLAVNNDFDFNLRTFRGSLSQGEVWSADNTVTGLGGGVLVMTITDNCATNRPLTRAQADLLGSLDVLIGTTNYPGLITRGRLKTVGPPLGILIDPVPVTQNANALIEAVGGNQ